MNMRRAFVSLMLITAAFLMIWFQLFLVQLIRYDHYSSRRIDLVARAVFQRERGVVLDDGRGRIVDRSGRALTGLEVRALAIQPAQASAWLESHASARQPLLELTGMTQEEWDDLLDQDNNIQLWKRNGSPVPLSEEQAEAISRMRVAGVQAVPYMIRYKEPFYASHALGFVSQDPERLQKMYPDQLANGSMRPDAQIGASGVEKQFERYLHSRGATSFSVFTDATGRPLQGLNSRMLSSGGRFYPLHIVTTLDMELQSRIEQLLDRKQIKEASVVLLDARNADVLVMANRPNYDPRHPDPHSTDWMNPSLIQQVPGSIFKIVIAAAALEYGVVSPHEHFQCNGEYGRYGFSCWKKDGHGNIDIQQAFADSCNITFAEIAKRLTPEQIEQTAWKLGVGRTIGWAEKMNVNGTLDEFRQFDHEEAGHIFADNSRTDEGEIIQTAIGQRNVRMTPLQAANLVVSLLNQGTLTSPRIVSEVRYRDGGIKQRFPSSRIAHGGVSPHTANTILKFMQETVRTGTASALREHEWESAGKTGTAQTGTHRQSVNHWFVGYGPTRRPLVAASVVVYHAGPNEANQAVELYAEIMDIVRQAYELDSSGKFK